MPPSDSFTHCIKCGAEKNDGEECLKCGVIYVKAERVFLKKEQEKEEEKERERRYEEEQERASANRRPYLIAFDYEDAGGSSTSREVKEPVRFLFSDQWYINGYCLLRKEARTFRVDRILGDIADAETGEVISIDRIMEIDPPDNLFIDPRSENSSSNLTDCSVCGLPISKNAETCPHCGEPVNKENPSSQSSRPSSSRKPMGCLGWSVVIIFVLYLIGQCNHPPSSTKPPRSSPSSSPPISTPRSTERYRAPSVSYADTFVTVLNTMYGNVCRAELNGFFSKTLKVDWTGNTQKIHAIKVIAEVGNAKYRLYENGVRYFQFPNDSGTYNVIDWETGSKRSTSERARYYFR